MKNSFWTMVMMIIIMIGIISVNLAAEDIFINRYTTVPLPQQNGELLTPFSTISGGIDYFDDGLNLPADHIVTYQIMTGEYNENVELEITLPLEVITQWTFRAYNNAVVSISADATVLPLFYVSNMNLANVLFENITFHQTSNEIMESTGFFTSSTALYQCYIETLRFFECSFENLTYGIYITEPPYSSFLTLISNFEVVDCTFNGIKQEGVGILTSAANQLFSGEQIKFIKKINIDNNDFFTTEIVDPLAGYAFDGVFIRNYRKSAPAYDSVFVHNNTFTNNNPRVTPTAIHLQSINKFPLDTACDKKLKTWVFENDIKNYGVVAHATKLKYYQNNTYIPDLPNNYFMVFSSLPAYCDTLWAERNYTKAHFGYSLTDSKLLDYQNSYFGINPQGATRFFTGEHSQANLTNSLITGFFTDFFLTPLNCLVQTQYCFYDEVETNTQVVYGNGIVTGNPLIVPDDDNMTYSLLWDANQKSPCIDSGKPSRIVNNQTVYWYDDPLNQDSDGTRMDIGAVPLLDGHIQAVHKLNHDSSEQIKWEYISFPGMVNIDGNHTQNTFEYVFDTYPGINLFSTTTPILNKIEWIYNSINHLYRPLIDDIPDVEIYSQYGFKVQMMPNVTEKILEYTGYPLGTLMNIGMYEQTNPAEHYIKEVVQDTGDNCARNPYNNIWYRMTYLGYNLSGSLAPLEAFQGPVLQNIIAILAEDWGICRVPILGYQPLPGDEPADAYTDDWLGYVHHGVLEQKINPGEMVEVHYIGLDPVSFQMGGLNPNFTEPYYRDMPTHYTFDELPNYVPIYLSINMDLYEEGNKPVEVAVFVDGICKGASVIKEGYVELNAYVRNSPSEELKNLEFRMYFPSKSNCDQKVAYTAMNNHTGRYEIGNATVADCKTFLCVTIGKETGNVAPLATKLMANYPNPFNPETTIKFDLAKSGKVKLEIYNVKGQLVKTLLNGDIKADTHSFVWNGKDGNGKAVASGVYYYKLITKEKSLTHKMLMLK